MAPPKKPDFSRLTKKRDLQEQDYELWKQWNQGGRKPEDLNPLFRRFRGRINAETNKWSGVELPRPVVKAEFQKKFVQALDSYDPNSGKLNTWIGTNFRQANRFLQGHASVARIPESRVNMIGNYKNAKASLEDELGRDPNSLEIANRLGVPFQEVEKLQREMRASITDTSMTNTQVSYSNTSGEIIKLMQDELSPEELFVFEHSVGAHGKPKLSGQEIAKRMRKSQSTVSRVKGRVVKKMRDLQGLLDE